MKGTKSHRERKNGAAREAWEKRKAAANAARNKQGVLIVVTNESEKFIRRRHN